MSAYQSFARVYDMFMDNIPYDAWCEYVAELLRENQIENGILLELGCGTGSVTQRLAKKGYDMIGVDNAPDMLEIAMEKKEEGQENILYLLQDMREFELYGTVRAVVSICDSMNYILEEEELLQVFRLVNNYLDPKGIFLFDLNTIYKYEEVLGDCTIAENRDEGSFIWENTYDEQEQINEYALTLFIKEEQEGKQNTYIKYEETHDQRAYSLEIIQELLERAGMEYVTAYDAFTKSPPKKDSERIYVLARESGKEE